VWAVRAADPAVTKGTPASGIVDLAANLGTICTLTRISFIATVLHHKGISICQWGAWPMKRDLKELRRIEQICLAEAALATMDIERIGLLKVAEDCRRSVDEIEARAALQSRVRSFLGVSWIRRHQLARSRGRAV
jgi:hypothetical protein